MTMDHSQRWGSPGTLALSTAASTSDAANTRTPSASARITRNSDAAKCGFCARPNRRCSELVGRQHLALKIRGDEERADDEPRHDVSRHDLQIHEVAALFRTRKRRVGDRGRTPTSVNVLVSVATIDRLMTTHDVLRLPRK